MIFYFSATGNSKYAAEKLQETFGGEMINIADAVRRDAFRYKPDQDEKVFFVLPVYFWNLPDIAVKFLREMDFEEEAEVCSVLTCGASAGGADRVFKKMMEKKNCQVKASYTIVMPDNCVVFFKIPNPEAQVMMLRKADKTIEEIIEAAKYGFRMGRRSGPLNLLVSKVGGVAYSRMRKTKQFWANDSCFGCGLCQTVCPESAITLEDGQPRWVKDKCTWCLGCINRCPVQAIQFAKKTEDRGRYVHPTLK